MLIQGGHDALYNLKKEKNVYVFVSELAKRNFELLAYWQKSDIMHP